MHIAGLGGKRAVLGVSGGIAAYKVAAWARNMVAEEAMVDVVMTAAAQRFVAPLTFETLSGNPVHCELFGDKAHGSMAHISLASQADFILVAPATANTIAKLAHGLADNLLTTTVVAAKVPVVVCPAMNCNMYSHRATTDNLKKLAELGYEIVDPDSGSLACGVEGMGRLPEWDVVRERLFAVLSSRDLIGKRILITAGPTREPLDPARFLSNRSSGKMGYALARTAVRRGALVTLISGPVSLPAPPGVEMVRVSTASEMYDEVMRMRGEVDVIVKSAAVADFRPAVQEDHKIKKSGGFDTIELTPNKDILAQLGASRRSGQMLVGFAAESRNHLVEGSRKLAAKNLDLIVVNDILGEGVGFDGETNQVTLIDTHGSRGLPLLSKEETAHAIWDRVLELFVQGSRDK